MSRVELGIHDLPRSEYDQLNLKEDTNEGAYWKTLETPSIEIVIFRRDEVDDEQHYNAHA